MCAHKRNPEFVHRHNQDGTFDSICLSCYRTAASSLTDSGLLGPERMHACSPVDLWHVQQDARASRFATLRTA